ncbi:hypothetical protein EV193_102565 [Herbihabitans rhizosphaerae]|uniref:Uncharacterized protein n=1 Tax=Herbihabitans rhizosphaerae TaxID=1872711 RepID=A0A4Q7L2X8_9PSEU|nr:hypothetical protein EV193_102565 [Herbihabitans rhizosphaerae]
MDAAALHDFQAKVWTERRGTTVGLKGKESGCSRANAEIAEQSAAKVVVRIVETVPKESRPCTMDIRYPDLVVHLVEPLANRTVVLTQEGRQTS